MHLVIGIPSYGNMPVEFVKSLIRLTEVLRQKNTEFSINIDCGAFLPHTRAKVCGADLSRGMKQRPFNDPKVTHILMIDSDIVFNPSDVLKLLECNLDFVAGVYPYSTSARQPSDKQDMVAGMWDENAFRKHRYFPPLNISQLRERANASILKLAEVDWVGLGFALVKTEVFEKITYPWFESERIQIDNFVDTTSEDVGFCRKLKAAGIRIMIDPSIRVGHYKSYTI